MLLEVDCVGKSYGALQVTSDVSLSLAEGSALGIIGPNGAGKTTLFNLITGTVLPDRGAIRFDGKTITRLPAHLRCRLGIARSFQIPHPFVRMSVFENVLVGAVFGRGMRERACTSWTHECLELTGLARKANVPAAALTLIERKRLELARAIATAPRLILLDEIAGGLTEPECKELLDVIAKIRARGVSIIWIEHIVHALLAVVDRIAVIDFGRKIADGNPREVMRSREVAEIYMGIEPGAEEPALA